jgi:hypothetical protein
MDPFAMRQNLQKKTYFSAMDLKVRITDPEAFKEAWLQFKRHVERDIHAEMVDDYVVLKGAPSEGNKQYLFELASLYGGQRFYQNYRLRLLENQPCSIRIESFEKEKVPIEINTRWNQRIEFYPGFLRFANSVIIRRFIDMMSVEDQEKLKNEVSDIDFDQPVSFVTDIKYAYGIIDNTLILIREQNRTFTITNLWRTEWYVSI